MDITFATGCSGIGAPEVAWGDCLGWRCLWCSEIDRFPSAVLKAHWPKVPNVGDFMTIAKRIRSGELEAPDVFVAGTPCQAFSVAGLRESLDDERGGLTLEYTHIADAMDEQRRSRGLPETIYVWEKRPGRVQHQGQRLRMLPCRAPRTRRSGRTGRRRTQMAVLWRPRWKATCCVATARCSILRSGPTTPPLFPYRNSSPRVPSGQRTI